MRYNPKDRDTMSTNLLDIFLLLNNTLYCNTRKLGLALLDTCVHTIQYFQSGLTYIIVMLESTNCSKYLGKSERGPRLFGGPI